ncbi:MAG: glycogen/starch synthase [Tannerella sp.]|jgi:glycosyltransferase involved in cell wall biosynthesis|nr:glycogen/starch synthase [Tannerella sp.]
MNDYHFECSWEVCNKVGGIYTVLSTKANTLHQQFEDQHIYIGPDLGKPCPEFEEDTSLFADWVESVANVEKFSVKTGRWKIPGEPPAILVDYKQLFADRDMLYFSMWESFNVDSSHSYGDYDESCIFAYSVARVIQSFYTFHHLEKSKVIAHFHEWMLGMGLLYIRKNCPAIATVFTTHATSIGRSIAGNYKPLYDYMEQYNGDRMAHELNMAAKHSLEKQTAHFADCFTTVSQITALECKQLLCKKPDVITPNGFEPSFVPDYEQYAVKRYKARQTLLNIAAKLTGSTIDPNAFLVSTSGRYEYRNKGIDVFIDAINMARISKQLTRNVIAFVMIPAWIYAPRADLKEILRRNEQTSEQMQKPFITHWLNQMQDDRIMNHIAYKGFTNRSSDKLKIIFIPCYLDGQDGIVNSEYYDILIGMDATVFPSYYEPWGYTPLESIAFGIPTITTDLAGFGMWAKSIIPDNEINEGVSVVHRSDNNYNEVVSTISGILIELIKKETPELQAIKKKCFNLATKAEWSALIANYYAAYDIALSNAGKRFIVDESSSCA